MGPRILLTTTVNWPAAARLACAFAGVRARVEALFPAGHLVGRSRFLAAGHRYYPLFPLASLRAAITRAKPDLVIPCDDRAMAQLVALAALDPHMRSLIAVSLGKLESYPALSARHRFIAAAAEAGIAAPQTERIESERALDAALARSGFPAVLKADASWGGEGVAIVRTMDQAKDAFRRLSAGATRLRNLARAVNRGDLHFLHSAFHLPNPSINLQHFVPGTPATTAFACWQGRVLASIHMDVLETVRPNGPASVMRRIDCPEMEWAAVNLAARFGLSGLHGLDFVRDPDGRVHLIEINPRATPASALPLGVGHDLAAALAGCVSPGMRGTREVLTDNPVIALFPQEWRRNPRSSWLRTAYLDAPWDDPAVLRASLEPGEPVPEQPSAVSAILARCAQPLPSAH
jgi:hypothetical protein